MRITLSLTVVSAYVALSLVAPAASAHGFPGTQDRLALVNAQLHTTITLAQLNPATPTDPGPLCASPKQARYIGSGSIEDAAQFQCEYLFFDHYRH